MNARRAAQRRSTPDTAALRWMEEGVEINMTVVHLWWAWASFNEWSWDHLRSTILTEWLTRERFAGIIIVSLMDNFNFLETRQFSVCWFVCNVYLPESWDRSWCWGRAGGGAEPAISQQTEDQSGDKIVNLTWIKITARLNSQLISEPDKFKIKYKHHPSFRYRGWQGFGFEGIFLSVLRFSVSQVQIFSILLIL